MITKVKLLLAKLSLEYWIVIVVNLLLLVSVKIGLMILLDIGYGAFKLISAFLRDGVYQVFVEAYSHKDASGAVLREGYAIKVNHKGKKRWLTRFYVSNDPAIYDRNYVVMFKTVKEASDFAQCHISCDTTFRWFNESEDKKMVAHVKNVELAASQRNGTPYKVI